MTKISVVIEEYVRLGGRPSSYGWSVGFPGTADILFQSCPVASVAMCKQMWEATATEWGLARGNWEYQVDHPARIEREALDDEDDDELSL